MNEISNYEYKLPERICQGNIYKKIWHLMEESEEEGNISKVKFAVVINQDCDLHQDYNLRENPPDPTNTNHDKYLMNILFCPLYHLDSFFKGVHLEEKKLIMQKIESSSERNRIKTNQNFRYHHFNKNLDYQLPDLIADFKHFFTIDREMFYKTFHKEKYYLCSLNYLYREELNQRFSNFLARIAIP